MNAVHKWVELSYLCCMIFLKDCKYWYVKIIILMVLASCHASQAAQFGSDEWLIVLPWSVQSHIEVVVIKLQCVVYTYINPGVLGIEAVMKLHKCWLSCPLPWVLSFLPWCNHFHNLIIVHSFYNVIIIITKVLRTQLRNLAQGFFDNVPYSQRFLMLNGPCITEYSIE